MIHKIKAYLFGKIPTPPDATKYYDGSGNFSTPSGSAGITSLTGDVTAVGPGASPSTIANDAVTTIKILDKNVTYAKIQDVTGSRLLGRSSTTSGVSQEIQLGTNLSFSGTTLNASGGGASTTANYIVSTTEAGLPNSHVLTAGSGITIVNTAGLTTISSSGGSSGWALVASWDWSTNVTNVDFTGLSGYSEIMMFFRNIALTGAQGLFFLVSINNGVSFLNSSGDYKAVDAQGGESNESDFKVFTGNTTTARSGSVGVSLFSTTSTTAKVIYTALQPKYSFVPTASALDAIRLVAGGGANMTSGNIRVYAR